MVGGVCEREEIFNKFSKVYKASSRDTKISIRKGSIKDLKLDWWEHNPPDITPPGPAVETGLRDMVVRSFQLPDGSREKQIIPGADKVCYDQKAVVESGGIPTRGGQPPFSQRSVPLYPRSPTSHKKQVELAETAFANLISKAAATLPDSLSSGTKIGTSKEHVKRLSGKHGQVKHMELPAVNYV
ncbi:hypothetical protein B0H67DRAFT_557341 [Lasiosphaeris hirsuta]|uniref:Uncharacterized protein n=1 Tax=Lasiosphaeris hirsuta TaxID=260670 RepID=A0AA39ZVY6_9PEZI|nr:hypothetical protein B0H67DRAFT_557341 [Lasiosphaeris hirsuta]